ncbi:cationic peroxidase 2-like [Argentina anserina]|uniref:cationic peroxidase 2-like n=1 Tax=Argentina anserina TaxID=57926 RepID=UPI0021768205|nr:cationic peroxidase 2-like [Potentilla anserina]
MYLKSSILLTILLIALATTLPNAQGKNVPRVGYYSRSCPRAESIVKKTVQSHFKSDATVAPALLRMHFHDCFVQGCDGSVLLDGPSTEKTAGPNQGLRGWEVIDDAKKKLEAACPGVVSCADILALAARDSVVLTKGIDWKVPTGRFDGRVSLASETSALPGFRDSIKVQKEKFKNLGLNTQDLVTLVGGHTIGTTACQFFSYRLYNFNTTGNGDVTDPAISPSFLSQLKSLCPQNGDGTKRVDLDTGSANLFDTKFFKNLKNGRGVLESDQMLWTDASTRSLVQRFLGVRGMQALNFNAEFGRSMVKMSKIGLKPAAKGEIRRVCSVIN